MKKVALLVTVVFLLFALLPLQTVQAKKNKIFLEDKKCTVCEGDTLKIKVKSKKIKKVIFVSDKKNIAIVNKKGVVTGLRKGKCTIFIFDKNDQNNCVKVKITVTKPKVKRLTDVYTQEELNLIYRIVETETFCADVVSKSHVASVIFNQINEKNHRFGKTVMKVLTYPNRFAYGRRKISKSTKEAVKMAFEKNTAPGCYAFHSGRKIKTFWGFKYSFTDEVGHHFYK